MKIETLNNCFLYVGLALCGACLYRMYLNGKQQAAELVIPDRLYLILLAVAAIAAVTVRIYQFGSVPGGFNQDGAMAAVDAKALADYGTDRYGMRYPVHLTAWGYGQMSSMLSYLMVPFIKLFGFSPLVLRLPQLLVSMAGLVCLYLFIREAFGKNPALFVFMFAAINPWHILQGRWVLDCNLYPHFFVIGIYFLYKGVTKRLFLILSMVLFGLSMYCYGISIYTMPFFLLAACIYLLVTKRVSVVDALISAGVYLLVAAPFILVMMVNFFQWDTIHTPLFTLPFFPDSIRSNDILFFSEDIGNQLVENFKSMMNVTILQAKDLPWNDIEGFGSMYLFSMPFFAVGIVVMVWRQRKEPGTVLTALFLLTGLLCGLLTNNVNINRINIVYYPIMIITGIGLYGMIREFHSLKWYLPGIYALAFCLFFNTYFTTYADEIRGYFHEDFGDALNYVKDADVDKYYITMYNAPDFTQILVLFHHETDAEYFQGKKNDGGLPFAEKYTIAAMSDVPVNTDDNAAYVANQQELAYFDLDLYDVHQFGYYYTLIRNRQNMEG